MLSHEELNITEAEHLALQAVAAGLAAGLYVHGIENYDGENIFDMYMQCSATSCGTVGCIGGWVGREMGMSIPDASDYVSKAEYEDIVELYYPEVPFSWSLITPAIAAEAIYQFLDGKPVDYPALLNPPLAAQVA